MKTAQDIKPGKDQIRVDPQPNIKIDLKAAYTILYKSYLRNKPHTLNEQEEKGEGEHDTANI